MRASMEPSHVELPSFIFRLDELTLHDQPINDRPVSSGPRQELAHGLLPHGMHGGDAQRDRKRSSGLLQFLQRCAQGLIGPA